MMITKIALPRRTFIRGMGATLALPFLDAMVPAMSALAKAAPRFAAIYCGNGANMNDWTPGHGRGGLRVLSDPEAARSRFAIGRSSSPGWTTFRRRTRATPAGSIRAPRRRS